MLSVVIGNVPSARVKLTNPVTSYVQRPLETPKESKVSQVPPPVTSCGLPEFERKVPEPVSVIFDPSLALAESCPPAGTVPVAQLTLIRSHRNCSCVVS